jgi:cyclopropane-fatty-acyl-phospholipid synthase
MNTRQSIIPPAGDLTGDLTAGRTGSARGTRGLAALGRRALLGRLEGLEHGQLTIRDGGETHVFGRAGGNDDPVTAIEVEDPQFWADAAFGGTVGAGESYIRGHWRATDLTALVRLMVRNRELMNGLEGGLAVVSAPLRRLLHFINRNTRRGSQRNIAAHYDLGNDFFRLMLDPTLAYSCGIYPTATSTLHEAQLAKFDAICRKLDLGPGDELVEIGTGWGGLAIHAARHYGCRVTTTTISREQHAHAQAAISAAGLASRITLLLEDYRDLTGRFDKLVSVEMIEAVGARFLDTYFATCSRLLKPSGAMLLQAITLQDQYYEEALRSVDFIQRFVFPGSFIPSVTAITQAVSRSTDLKLFHLEDIGPHYATTLRDWRRNVHAHLAEVRALGYPEQFLRLWDYYLCYCEGGFAERQIGDVQMLLTKPQCRRAPIVSLAP